MQQLNMTAFWIGSLFVCSQGLLNSLAMNEKVMHDFVTRQLVKWRGPHESPASDLGGGSRNYDSRNESRTGYLGNNSTSDLGLMHMYEGTPGCRMAVLNESNASIETYNVCYFKGRYS